MGEEHIAYFYEIKIRHLISKKIAEEIVKLIKENFPEAECFLSEHKFNLSE